MSAVLPKPIFHSCDETSLKLRWDIVDVSNVSELKLQYKEMHESWDEAKEYEVALDSPGEANLSEADVVDLKPGTPYFVRLMALGKDEIRLYGPETVFDTKPIDCTPKRRCIIC